MAVKGEVYRPAIFELCPARDERLGDVIRMAGGLTEFAYLEKIEISRIDSSGQRCVYYVNYNDIVVLDH